MIGLDDYHFKVVVDGIEKEAKAEIYPYNIVLALDPGQPSETTIIIDTDDLEYLVESSKAKLLEG